MSNRLSFIKHTFLLIRRLCRRSTSLSSWTQKVVWNNLIYTFKRFSSRLLRLLINLLQIRLVRFKHWFNRWRAHLMLMRLILEIGFHIMQLDCWRKLLSNHWMVEFPHTWRILRSFIKLFVDFCHRICFFRVFFCIRGIRFNIFCCSWNISFFLFFFFLKYILIFLCWLFFLLRLWKVEMFLSQIFCNILIMCFFLVLINLI